MTLMKIVTLNAGSSSVRFAAFEHEGSNPVQTEGIKHTTHHGTVEKLLSEFINRQGHDRIDAVAHRIVHGGSEFVTPCIIDPEIESRLTDLTPLAPLHNPLALRLIRSCRALLGTEVPQIAVFDTAFYHDLPAPAAQYALPASLIEQTRLRRYGFHGLAHQALWDCWSSLQPVSTRPRQVITLQLGSGCSITAIREGKPMDTSMGFTPLEGLMMATRAGDLDPGLILYLQRDAGMNLEQLDELLNHGSGLLGMSGLSADLRVLLESSTPAAQQAVDLYCYRARKYIGAYIAVLGGVDSIIFGGGVGENAPAIRARILDGMAWAGIALDSTRNQTAIGIQDCISTTESAVSVWILPVDEQQLMARAACKLLRSA